MIKLKQICYDDILSHTFYFTSNDYLNYQKSFTNKIKIYCRS